MTGFPVRFSIEPPENVAERPKIVAPDLIFGARTPNFVQILGSQYIRSVLSDRGRRLLAIEYATEGARA